MVQGNCQQRRHTRVSGMSSVSQGDGWVVQLCWALDRVSSRLALGQGSPSQHGWVPARNSPSTGNHLCCALLQAIKRKRVSVSEEGRETLCVSL